MKWQLQELGCSLESFHFCEISLVFWNPWALWTIQHRGSDTYTGKVSAYKTTLCKLSIWKSPLDRCCAVQPSATWMYIIISSADSVLHVICVLKNTLKNNQSESMCHQSSIYTLSIHPRASIGCSLRTVQTGWQLIAELVDALNGGLDGEEVLVFHLGTADPHELCQTHKVLDVMARASLTGGDLGGNVHIRSRAQIHGIVSSSNVDQGNKRLLVLLFWEELDRLYDISSQQNLSGVQVLEGSFDLGVRYLISHSPCAGLQENKWKTDPIMWLCQNSNIFYLDNKIQSTYEFPFQ